MPNVFPNWLDLLVMVLATWRLAYMLTREKGPFDVFVKLRGSKWHGGLLECIKCTSVYTAALMLGLYIVAWPVVVWLALSGAALMLSRYTGMDYEPDQ